MEAIILAGGLGTRLRSVVSEVPKCMAPVDGKPFLQYVLAWLSRFDITHVVLSVGYLKEQIIDFVQAREWPFEISYAVEKEPLGTGGGIRLALQKCRGKQARNFFACKIRLLLREGHRCLDCIINHQNQILITVHCRCAHAGRGNCLILLHLEEDIRRHLIPVGLSIVWAISC